MLPEKDNPSKRDKSYLFKCLLLANFLQYLEAGAVPALLIQLSESFHMGPAKQGLLGGVVYLSLSLGGPFAGYLLKSYHHKTVISCAVAANMFFTLVWALTPVGQTYSTNMFIAVRFIMGLCQCVICVFLPLWTNENAPKQTRTSWMSYLQASVPFGVMMGYIIASVLSEVSAHRAVCFGLLCWRWAFLIEIMLLTPLYLGLFYIPAEDIQVCTTAQDADLSRNIPDLASRSATATLSDSNKDSADNMHSLSLQKPSPSARKSQRQQGDIEAPAASLNITPKRPSFPSPSLQTPSSVRAANNDQRRGHMTPQERLEHRSWRKTAMSASLFDPMSARYALKKSCDDMAVLDPDDSIFPALPTPRKTGTGSKSMVPTLKKTVQSSPGQDAGEGRKPQHPQRSPRYSHLPGDQHALPEQADEEGGEGDAEGEYYLGATPDEDVIFRSKTSEKVPKSRSRSSDAAMWSGAAQRASVSGAAHRPEPSRLGKRRLSLQEWLLGSLPGLPYAAAAQDEESQGLLDGSGDRASNNYSGLDDGFNNYGQNGKAERTRRSLDTSFRASAAKKEKQHNRRSSTSAVGHSAHPSRQHHHHHHHGKKKAAQPVQYESFRDLTRKNTFVGNSGKVEDTNSRASWGVFSMLGYNAGTSPPTSTSALEYKFPTRMSKSDKHGAGRSRGSPFDRLKLEASEGTHKRSYSSGDVDPTGAPGPPGDESPSSPAPHTNRTRTFSNPEAASATGSFMLSVPSPDKVDGQQEGTQEDSAVRAVLALRSQDEDATSSEEDPDEFPEDDSIQDDISVSFDELSGSGDSYSESESEEEWGGLTPPPIGAADYTETPPPSTRQRQSVSAGLGVELSNGGEESASDGSTSTCERLMQRVRRAFRYIGAVLETVRALLAIKTYRCLLGAMSALYFTVTGVQFWGTKYLTIALHAPLPLVSTLFILCAATGPTLGVFFGGWIIDKNGGYKGAHQRVVALELCSTFGVLACFFSLPITLLSNIFAVVGFLWVVLFFGGAMLPACSGIVVSIIPRAYRPISSSLALMVFNMFGYFLSLLLSGYLMQVLDAHRDVCDEVCSMTWGFRLVLFWSFISVAFLISALFASYQHLKDRDRGRGRSSGKRRRRSSYRSEV